MTTAGIGNILYIIIALVLIFGGGIEKYLKAKKQQVEPQPDSPEPEWDVEETNPQPATLEDTLKRWMTQNEETAAYDEEAQSLETIPDNPPEYEPQYEALQRDNMKSTMHEGALDDIDSDPITNNITDIFATDIFATDITVAAAPALAESLDFDIRKAVIASEILNRKYT
jgi:hypothetical protein